MLGSRIPIFPLYPSLWPIGISATDLLVPSLALRPPWLPTALGGSLCSWASSHYSSRLQFCLPAFVRSHPLDSLCTHAHIHTHLQSPCIFTDLHNHACTQPHPHSCMQSHARTLVLAHASRRTYSHHPGTVTWAHLPSHTDLCGNTHVHTPPCLHTHMYVHNTHRNMNMCIQTHLTGTQHTRDNHTHVPTCTHGGTTCTPTHALQSHTHTHAHNHSLLPPL
jgi:hypothetical protein